MKNSQSRRSVFFIAFCFMTLLFQMYCASQVYSGLTLDTVESHEILSLDAKSDWKASSTNNTENTVFQSSKGILEVSAERNQSDSSKAIFEVSQGVAIPLRQDLALSFSLFASQLNLNADAGRLYIALSNGTNTILLNYVVGYREPDWEEGAFSYAFYQVGDNLNVWFDCERNVWDDLTSKNFTLKSSWDVISITFGCISYWNESSFNNKMDIFLDASRTSLYYEESTFTIVIPAIRLSWLAISGMVAGVLLFPVCSVALVRTRKQPGMSRLSEKRAY